MGLRDGEGEIGSEEEEEICEVGHRDWEERQIGYWTIGDCIGHTMKGIADSPEYIEYILSLYLGGTRYVEYHLPCPFIAQPLKGILY